MKLTQEYTSDIEGRFKYGYVIVLALTLIVVARLYYLQVIRGSFYHFFSTENSIKAIKIPAVRGVIFDRRGQVLVDNRPSFNIVVIPQYVVDPEKTLDSLATLLRMPRSDVDAAWAKRIDQPRYQPLVIREDASLDDVALIRTRKNPWYDEKDPYDLRGVDVDVRYQRTYPESNMATHVLGYVREIDPDRLKLYSEQFPGKYHRGDTVGIRGLEERWDPMLRGTDGYEEKVVNAVGREVDYEGIASELERKEAVAGASLRLTIDRDLQEIARDMFNEKGGAAVAISVKTGAVLAMFSAPSYDLNRLASPEGSDYWNYIAGHPSKFLLNRVIQGGYPPGSTYKIVSALAALSEGVVKPTEKVTCSGALTYGGRPYHCWRKGGHGAISIHDAIVSSCDVYFYNMGLRLGVDRLAKYANMIDFGRLTGVPLDGEKPGVIPTSEWKLKRYGVPWQGGENLSIAVGQGYDVVTPMQNSMLAAVVASGGKKPPLHFVEEAYDVGGGQVYKWNPPREIETVDIKPEVLKMVKDAMVGVVAEPGGTAHRLSQFKVTMGGKTGTAQVIQLDGKAVCKSDICKDHAWFIGFAPADDPEIAGAVVVEHGGFGASAAAPIIGAMFQKYYDVEHGG
jgi:penicillin-binding protein 2